MSAYGHGNAMQRELSTTDPALGTTIMAASFDGGVILAADSRTSTGSYVANRVTNKLTQLAENVFICRSGSAADTQAISSYVQYFVAQHIAETGKTMVETETVANLTMQLAYNNKSMLSAGMIVAGYDEETGGSVWGIPLGGTLIKVPYTIGGSGSAYIYGFCDKNWRDGMTEQECRAFVLKSVALAIGRDGSSGGCVRMVIINKDGARREFVPGDQVPPSWGEMIAPKNPPPATIAA